MSDKKLNRREFTKIAASTAAALGLSSKAIASNPNPIKTQPLKTGSRVALVAPATRVKPEWLERAKTTMESLGLEAFHRSDILDRHGNFAGTDKRRLDELHQMYRDKSVDAIWTVGGGYGTTRINDRLDFRLIKRNRKPLIGYSDLTGLLNTIHERAGSPCFHGPVAAGNLTSDFSNEL